MAVDEEYYDDEEFDDGYDDGEDSLGAALQAQFKSAPWYASSLAIHTVLFLLMIIFTPPPEPPEAPPVVIMASVEEPPEDEPEEEPEEPEVEPEVVTETTEEVEITTEVAVETDVEVEVEEEVTEEPARGDPSAFSDLSSDVDSPALMGIGNRGGAGGSGGRFGTRGGKGKARGLRRGGGGRKTEDTVNWALKWLAYHQEPDGHWDNMKYEALNNGQPLPKPGTYDVPSTSLALLAFLGAGNSSKFGKYKKNVAAAQAWLASQQKGNGAIGPYKYEAAISLMAVVEAYGMSEDPALKAVAQAATDRAVAGQNTTGAWDYGPNSGRSDTSPTGWWMMGLKSARVAGLKIPKKTWDGAKEWFEQACRDNGKCWYALEKGQWSNDGSGIMAAAGLCCRLFLGYPKNDAKIVGLAQALITENFRNCPLPTHQENEQMTCFYGWYYEALGFYQLGTKSPYWVTFNPLMKQELLSTQRMDGTVAQYKGSWNPPEFAKAPGGHLLWHGADNWGRVGQTAVGALMLEVYYRYAEVKGH